MKNKKAISMAPQRATKMVIVFLGLFVVAAVAVPPMWDSSKNLFDSFGLTKNRCDATGFTAEEYNAQIDYDLSGGDIPAAKETIISFINCFYEDFEDLVWITSPGQAYQIAEEFCIEGYLKESEKVFNVIEETGAEDTLSDVGNSLKHKDFREICSDLKDLHYSSSFTPQESFALSSRIQNEEFPVWDYIIAEKMYHPDYQQRIIFDLYASAYAGSLNQPNDAYSQEFINVGTESKNKIKEIYFTILAEKLRDLIFVQIPTTNSFCFKADSTYWKSFTQRSDSYIADNYLSKYQEEAENINCIKYFFDFYPAENSGTQSFKCFWGATIPQLGGECKAICVPSDEMQNSGFPNTIPDCGGPSMHLYEFLS